MPDKNKILSLDSMAVLIDCWEHVPVFILNNIVESCTTDPSIKTVVLSTYVPKLKGYFSAIERQWYPRTKKIFYDNALAWNELAEVWTRSSDYVMTKSFTHEIIRDMPPVPGQTRFLAQQSLYLLYYLNVVNPAIKNIYFLGGAWEQCLKWRATGWREIAYLIHIGLIRRDINLLTRRDCVYGSFGTNNDPFKEQWKQLDQNVYQLDRSLVDFNEKPSSETVSVPFDYRKG